MEMKFTPSVRTAIAFALKLVGGQIGDTPGFPISDFDFFSDIQATELKDGLEEALRGRAASRTVTFYYKGNLVAIVLLVTDGEGGSTDTRWKVDQFRYKSPNGILHDLRSVRGL